MRSVLFRAVPFVKEEVTLALESGVDGVIVPKEYLDSVSSLARISFIAEESVEYITLESKQDEVLAAEKMSCNKLVTLKTGWEIIPVENLIAHAQIEGIAIGKKAGDLNGLALEVNNPEEAKLAAGILEQGVDILVVPAKSINELKYIIASAKFEGSTVGLVEAEITSIEKVGMGHRVCVDTLSNFRAGQGMLVGNSAAFTFLVNAETEHNEYVASRPFRVNAGAVHAYAIMPEDKTTYLSELKAGSEVLIVDEKGNTELAVVGRVKVEKRPMLLIKAKHNGVEGAVFLQNAETIRVVTPNGIPVSVVNLAVGNKILCHLDVAGRHFGMRIKEDIIEG